VTRKAVGRAVGLGGVILLAAAAMVSVAWARTATLRVYLDDKDATASLGATLDPATGRVLVPLRALAEALGLRVSWDPAAGAVYVHTPVPTCDSRAAAAVYLVETYDAMKWGVIKADWAEVISPRALGAYRRWQDAMAALGTPSDVGQREKLTYEILNETGMPFLQDMAEATSYFPNYGTRYENFAVLGARMLNDGQAEVRVREYLSLGIDERRYFWRDQVYEITWVEDNGALVPRIDRQYVDRETGFYVPR